MVTSFFKSKSTIILKTSLVLKLLALSEIIQHNPLSYKLLARCKELVWQHKCSKVLEKHLFSKDEWSQESNRVENVTKYLQYKSFDTASIGKKVYQFDKIKKDHVLVWILGYSQNLRRSTTSNIDGFVFLSLYTFSPPSFRKFY
ncbi:hypothetical protein NPIL_486231 [Nephila pilipes]|uniref:Uncharacterized protein n=1 Tax=Nephila pilipes TaxID=299642 RepID=A0A8X6P4X6_NEPPI|nr:hypothetical protein NPIL_486231 [Nephila pilipes]